MIKNNHNSACAFAEDLVSYLYGEIGEQEKANFETHLHACRTCAEELSAFGVVRSTILEWRQNDFSPLKTPSFELPAKVETVSSSRSWLVGLREIFSLRPAFATVATAFAVMLIGAGLFYVGTNLLRENNPDEISSVNEKMVVKDSEPKPKAQLSETEDDAANRQTVKSSASSIEAESKKIEKQTAVNDKKRAVTVSGKTTAPLKTKILPKPGSNLKPSANSPHSPKKADMQLLSDRSEEDETLRLMDLLEEIGKR